MMADDKTTSRDAMTEAYPTSQYTYLPRPDYSRPLFQIPDKTRKRIRFKLEVLYGHESVEGILVELERIMKVFYAYKTTELIEWEKNFVPEERFSENDLMLITYGDLIHGSEGKPLQTLARICRDRGKELFSIIHVLPFFPYSSDRGFAIMDFEEVDPILGSWEDIEDLGREFRLMFDGVINHASSKSRWFQEFLDGNPDFQDAFIKFGPDESIPEDFADLILRPRTSDVLSTYHSFHGKVRVWTTFSTDQIDLNFKHPKVLLKMIEILLFYVRKGADLIRLDAVTYLWCELGTRCAHLDQTHLIIRLFRDILDAVAPYVALITETNVPHEENIEYFGNGSNEAQMVYNFALPPLVLHTFYSQDVSYLLDWAATLNKVSNTATYLNFLDSHDGIGVMGAKEILPPEAIEEMASRIVKHGGFISYRTDEDGTETPYELNSTWFSALNDPHADESRDLQVRRFTASRSIALALRGVPATYMHGIYGSPNDRETALLTRSNRGINRHTVEEEHLIRDAKDPTSIWFKIRKLAFPLYRVRKGCRAFHPNGDQKVFIVHKSVFSLIRICPDGREKVLCLTNVSDRNVTLSIAKSHLGENSQVWEDLIESKAYPVSTDALEVTLEPYEVLWLKPKRGS